MFQLKILNWLPKSTLFTRTAQKYPTKNIAQYIRNNGNTMNSNFENSSVNRWVVSKLATKFIHITHLLHARESHVQLSYAFHCLQQYFAHNISETKLLHHTKPFEFSERFMIWISTHDLRTFTVHKTIVNFCDWSNYIEWNEMTPSHFQSYVIFVMDSILENSKQISEKKWNFDSPRHNRIENITRAIINQPNEHHSFDEDKDSNKWNQVDQNRRWMILWIWIYITIYLFCSSNHRTRREITRLCKKNQIPDLTVLFLSCQKKKFIRWSKQSTVYL